VNVVEYMRKKLSNLFR